MKPVLSRRSFLAAATTAAAVAGSTPVAAAAGGPKCRLNLAIASYSYWHFRDQKVPIEAVMDKAAAMDADAVDILHRQMEIEEKAPLDAAGWAYLRKLKRHALLNGLEICCLSTHQTFVSPNPEVVTKNIDHTQKCIEIAYELGCPCIRINTGRWGTTKDFDELMAHRGIEPILPGHTEEDGFRWCVDGIERCLPKAEQCGVVLALENHWGLARTPEGLLRILESIASPWLGALMDTGNFLEEPYEKLRAIASRTVYVQAKTYPGGGEWYTLDLDYRRIARILADVDYRGYVGLEMEGKEDPETAVPKSVAMLREAFG
ncbi:MAG: sugar phosphate isomerase/epimerase [Pirellulales bacterium]|nr:sugar phosphate isomerase/epimerase [Pirellulales bacterium]